MEIILTLAAIPFAICGIIIAAYIAVWIIGVICAFLGIGVD